MKKYSITINGTTYIAEVEELDAARKHRSPLPQPHLRQHPRQRRRRRPQRPAGGKPVKAPMPGTIAKVNVTVGQSVKKGEVLAILEAMKMENDIPAPEDGTVASVNVQKGASVQTDDVIVTLK